MRSYRLYRLCRAHRAGGFCLVEDHVSARSAGKIVLLTDRPDYSKGSSAMPARADRDAANAERRVEVSVMVQLMLRARFQVRPFSLSVVALVAYVTASACSGGSSVSGPSFGGTSRTGSAPSALSKKGAQVGKTAVQRAHFKTAIGDPATADLCSAQPFATVLGADSVGPEPTHALGRCDFAVKYTGGSIEGEIDAVPPQQESKAPPRTTTTAHGAVTVVAWPRVGTSCERWIRLRGTTLFVQTGSTYKDQPDAEVYCQTADFLTKKVLAKLDSGGFDPLPLATSSVANVDICKTLSTSSAAAALLVSSTRVVSAAFGNVCSWNSAVYSLKVEATVSTEYSRTHANTITVEGHQLIPLTTTPTAMTPSCTYASPQGRIEVNNGQEFITVTASTTNTTGAKLSQLCPIARRASIRVLTNAGLR